MRRKNPDWVFHHLSDAVPPALRQRGVDEAQIDQMLVANPPEAVRTPRWLLNFAGGR
jgi:predicted metal-dependent phosphotriesterase family hydrolase